MERDSGSVITKDYGRPESRSNVGLAPDGKDMTFLSGMSGINLESLAPAVDCCAHFLVNSRQKVGKLAEVKKSIQDLGSLGRVLGSRSATRANLSWLSSCTREN